MIYTCSNCGKNFEEAPYYYRVGGTFKPICSVQCLHQVGEKLDGE